jgi:hypothetical protein
MLRTRHSRKFVVATDMQAASFNPHLNIKSAPHRIATLARRSTTSSPSGSMGGCKPVDPPGPDIRITPHVQKARVPVHQTLCSTLVIHRPALHKQQLLPPQSNGTNSAPLSCR